MSSTCPLIRNLCSPLADRQHFEKDVSCLYLARHRIFVHPCRLNQHDCPPDNLHLVRLQWCRSWIIHRPAFSAISLVNFAHLTARGSEYVGKPRQHVWDTLRVSSLQRSQVVSVIAAPSPSRSPNSHCSPAGTVLDLKPPQPFRIPISMRRPYRRLHMVSGRWGRGTSEQ